MNDLFKRIIDQAKQETLRNFVYLFVSRLKKPLGVSCPSEGAPNAKATRFVVSLLRLVHLQRLELWTH